MAAQPKITNTLKRLVIADPLLDDYQCLVEPARKHRVRLTLTTTGSNALRLAPSFTDALWLVSPKLPDMDGLDLLEMLHSLQCNLSAVVIDNEYDRQRELRALELKAIQYVCKPLQLLWLEAWQGIEAIPRPESSPAIRPENWAQISS